MNKTDFESIVKKHLHQVAPEVDLEHLNSDDDIGSALDIDSMDFYNVMVAISEELNIDIPEEKFSSLRTMTKIKEFLKEATDH